MKTVVLLFCVLLVTAVSASAQTEAICLFSDEGGTQCDFVDTGGLIQVHIYHQYSDGAAASQFKLDIGDLPWTFLGDLWQIPSAIGSSITGVSAAYGSCLTSPIHIGAASFFGSSAPPDAVIRIVPDPATGYLRALDCNDFTHAVAGGTAYVNSTLPCLCESGPNPDPLLYVHPLTVDLGETETTGSFLIENNGGETLYWTVSRSVLWLDVSPTNGSESGTITVIADRSGLPAGNHTALVHVSSNGGTETVTVTLTVPAPDPALGVSPGSLSFGDLDTERNLQIFNAGGGELNWTITADQPWLSAVPASGVYDQTVTVSVDRTGLGDGLHEGDLFVTSDGGNATVPVDMWVGVLPVLSVAPVLLIYTPDVVTHTFAITNAGTGTLEWSLGDNKDWIEIVPPLSGTGDATVTVNVDPALVPDGSMHSGLVTVSSNAGDALVAIRFVRGASSAAGTIAVFSDAAGTSCNFVDSGGLVQVHFFHMNSTGATASQWRLDVDGTGWIHLGDMWPYPTTIGRSIDGVSLGYGSCISSPNNLGLANFFGSSAPACSMIRIVADPSAISGDIEAVDCGSPAQKVYPTGGYGRVNPDATCTCGDIPVQHTTWGAIKAMYQPD